jgi:lipopolysaccharide export system protein LptC
MGDRVAWWVAILMMSLVLVASYWYAQDLRGQGGGDTGRIGQVDFFAEKIALTGFDVLGRGHYRLFADRMTHYGNSDDVDLTEPRLLSMRTDQPLLQAVARRAHVHNNAETVQMSGAVVVTRAGDANHPPLRLETEELYTAPDDDRYWTDAPVRMHGGDSVMQGVGMDYDNVTRHLDLRARVTGDFPPRSQP